MPDTAIIAAFVGLLSAVLGGFIQAILARKFERYKFEQESKWDLYSKYFLTLAELSFSDGKSDRHINALSLMAQLRGRIGVVGSPEVIVAVGNVFKYGDLRSANAQVALAQALRAMRGDVGKGREAVSDQELIQLMFGSMEKLT
jgi:hypothetical protein